MKLFKIYILLLVIFPCISAAQTIDTAKYQSLDPYYFHLQYLKEEPALLIDVRQLFEFKGRRIKDAINISSSKELDDLVDTLSRNTSLFLYCTDGFRSKRAAELLYEKGFRKLYNLEGGIMAWKKDGFPVEKGKIKKKRK